MEHQQKYILLRDGAHTVRCCIKRIVCIVSQKQGVQIYEWIGDNQPVRKLDKTYRLSWFQEQITDPHFFEIYKGTLYNTRFYLGHTNERILHSRGTGLPQLIISTKVLNAFKKHLTRW